MPFATSGKSGDIVLLGFPFTNLETIKKRPAVVISSEACQRENPINDLQSAGIITLTYLNRDT